MMSFVLTGLALYGYLLASFIFLEVSAVIIGGIYRAVTKFVLNHERFIQKINQIGIGQEQKFDIIRGRYFYALDMAFSSAVEQIESEEMRVNFMKRRRKIFEEMNKEVGGQKSGM